MNYLDLFSGIGGFALGFQQAGFDFNKHYFSEVDKYAESIYMRKFPESVRLGDVTKINNGLGEIDIITAGFPCQAFSIAGKREGFNDTRGTLFFDVARLSEKYRPRYMVLENVKGLLNHERGDTIRVILAELGRLGYWVELLLCNTKDFGIPQNRERVFFICTARGERRPEIFRLRERKTEIACGKELNPGQSDAHRVREPAGASVTLKSEGGGLGAKTGLYAVMSKKGDIKRGDSFASTLTGGGHSGGNHSDMDMLAIPVLTPDRTEKRQNGRRFKTNNEPMFTLTAQDRHGVVTNKPENYYEFINILEDYANGLLSWDQVNTLIDIRRLTPTECERLQSFSDGWTQYGVNGEIISDTQRYKCCGNSVTVKVIEEIAKEIKAVL